MTLATIVAFAAEEAHHGNVQLETMWLGGVALGVFAVLALITVSFRNVANRHSPKAEQFAERHAHELQHGGSGHH